jgi:hypothetical protein
MPSVSANCCEMEARVSPISGDPSVRWILPSLCTTATVLDSPVLLRHNPLATPRPRYGRVKRDPSATTERGVRPCQADDLC